MSIASPTESRHFRFQDLGNGVYAAIATPDGWAVGNAGIVDLGDHTLVFDTFASHLAAEDFRVAAEAATGRSVDLVVNSHAHRDHIKGNQVFAGATIAATRKTCEAMTRNWRIRRERVRAEGLDPIRRAIEDEFSTWKANPATDAADRVLWESYRQAILEGIEAYDLRLPSVSFDTSLHYHGSKRSAEALAFGGGHSEGDAILFVPDQRVAFLGDLLFISIQPYLGDGDPEEELKILDRIEALDPKWLVPGHGPVGTVRDLQAMRDYVLAVQRTADAFPASEAGATEAAKAPIPPPFDTMGWKAFWSENLSSLLRKKADAAKP